MVYSAPRMNFSGWGMTGMAEEETAKKPGKGGLIIGAVLMLALGGGGFGAVWSGLILGGAAEEHAETGADGEDKDHGADKGHGDAAGYGGDAHAVEGAHAATAVDDVAFLPIEPFVVTLGPDSQARRLRFRAELEVPQSARGDVAYLMPRVVDVMNGYLRAVDPADFEDRGALIRLRAQLLRRVELVVGADRVRDVLVMEFVLS